jgi:autotransporter-associated beta strand protein
LAFAAELAFPTVSGAAALTWDPGAMSTGAQDGSGTWDTSSNAWWNGTGVQAWSNAAGNDAVFGAGNGPAGTVSLSTSITAGNLIFSAAGSGNYLLTGGTLNLTGGTITANEDATIQSVIAGTAGVTKAGAGTLTLSGSNTYTGATVVSGGVLRLNSASALPGGMSISGGTSNLTIGGGIVEVTDISMGISRGLGTGPTQVQFTGSGGFSAYCNQPNEALYAGVYLSNGATLTWGVGGFVPDGSELWLSSADSNAAVNFQNPINLNGSLRTVRVADGSMAIDAQLSGVLSGSGGLEKAGNGALSISAANSYTGQTVIAGGVLDLQSTSALPGGIGATGGTSSLNLSGGVLQLESGQTFSRSLGTASSQVQFTGSGGFAAAGSNCTVNLGGSSATVVWGASSFVPAGCSLLLGSAISNATVNFQNPINFGSSLRTINVSKGSASFDAQLNGLLTGTAGFEKSGPGTLELTAANTYSGPTVVSGGILGLSNANALPGGTAFSGGSSNLVLAGGVVELRKSDFYRGLGTGPDQVQFTGSGGFSGSIAYFSASFGLYGGSSENRGVNLGGQSAPVAWGVGGFVPDGSTFILGATGACGILDFQNSVNLGSSSRTIEVDGVSPYNSNPPFGYVTLSGGITGNGSLTKSGNGILKLTTASTYAGDTQVTGGILELANPQALPGGIGPTGGTGRLSISGGGELMLDCGSFQRPLGTGPGAVQFSGSGGFAGGASPTVNFGGASAPIIWDNNPCFPDDLTLILENVNSNGPMDLQNPIVLGPGLRTISTGAGCGNVHARLSGCVSGVGGLSKIGDLVLEVTAANTYTGQTQVNGGILRLSNAQALPGGIGATGGTSNLDLTGSGSDWFKHSSGSFSCAVGAVGPVVELAAGNFTRGLGTGPSQVQFTGTGGFSAYGANYTVNLGGNSAQVVWGQNSFVPTGSALCLSSDYSNATIDFQNPINFASSACTVNVSDGSAAVDAKLSGVLSGAGGLAKQGSGTLELTAANTYTGQTAVDGGALRLSNPQALPGGTGATGGTSNLYLNGRVVELAAGDFFRGLGTGPSQVQFGSQGGFAAVGANRVVNLGGNSVSVTPGQNYFPGTLTLGSPNADATVDFQNRITMSFFGLTVEADEGSAAVAGKLSGVVSGSPGLTKTGNGTLELTAANTYTGQTAIDGGVLRLSNAQALPGGCGSTGGVSNLDFYGGIVELAAGDFLRAVGTGASQVQFAALRDGGFAAVGANRVVNLGGNSAPLSWGLNNFSPFTLVLGSPNDNATVDFQNPINFPSSHATIEVDHGSAAVDAKFSGVLSGTGYLTIGGNGVLQMTAANTFSGTTSLYGGRLLVDGSLASSPITVASGATLGGTGTIGQVTVNTGGQIAPGDTQGILTLAGDLTLQTGAVLDFALGTLSSSDEIEVPTNTLWLGGQQFADFDFAPLAGFGPGTYTLITAGSTNGSLGADTSGTIDGYAASLAVQGNALVLNVSNVPEPSTLALLGVGAVGFLGCAFRRRTKAA